MSMWGREVRRAINDQGRPIWRHMGHGWWVLRSELGSKGRTTEGDAAGKDRGEKGGRLACRMPCGARPRDWRKIAGRRAILDSRTFLDERA